MLAVVCPNCCVEGVENFRKHGFKQLYQRKVPLLQCKKCGRVFHVQ